MSSEEDYKPPGNTEKIWNQTSRWRPIQLEILKAEFINGEILNLDNIDTIQLDPDVERILLSGIDIKTEKNISKIHRPFYNRLIQLTTFIDEPPVDSVAHDLLTYTGYEDQILHFRPKPHLEMVWQGYDISSEADYGVYSERSRETSYKEYLVVVEDKPERRKSYQGGECQLYGEMLLAAFNRYTQKKQDQIVYGIIIRGPFIRFYKSNITKEYLKDIERDKTPLTKAISKRFPSDDEYPLSLNITKEREKIIRILHLIRKDVEDIVKN